jgi:hypothetical protein
MSTGPAAPGKGGNGSSGSSGSGSGKGKKKAKPFFHGEKPKRGIGIEWQPSPEHPPIHVVIKHPINAAPHVRGKVDIKSSRVATVAAAKEFMGKDKVNDLCLQHGFHLKLTLPQPPPPPFS